MEKVKFGIIGMSEGNGHPYSWSAIFNGYNEKAMALCPFPAIPEYLGKQEFPNDFLTHKGEVTHIYTQDIELSALIAKAAHITTIVENPEDLIGKVDAILLATDDGENHYKNAKIFIEAGLPIYIDKPLAITVKDALAIFKLQRYPHQVFTCSALRFASELLILESERDILGTIRHVEATVPKNWNTYAIHIIEPIISQLPNRGDLIKVKSIAKHGFNHCLIEWEHTTAYIKSTGNTKSSISFKYFGEQEVLTKEFSDSFSCFKNALDTFTEIVTEKSTAFIAENETLEMITIIENGAS